MRDEEKTDNKKQELEPTNIADKSSKEEFISREEAVAKSYFEEQMQGVKDRIGDTNFIMGVIVVVLAVGFLTLLGMVAGFLIDSFHINSATYTEYTKSTDTLNNLQKTNNILLQQISNQQQKELNATHLGK